MRARPSLPPSPQNRKPSSSGARRGRLFFACSESTISSRQPAGRWRYLMTTPAFKRVLLKISGEPAAPNQGFGVDNARIHEVPAELADVHKLGVQLGNRVGCSDFFRGVADQATDMTR